MGSVSRAADREAAAAAVETVEKVDAISVEGKTNGCGGVTEEVGNFQGGPSGGQGQGGALPQRGEWEMVLGAGFGVGVILR